jgi:hypothetical protein
MTCVHEIKTREWNFSFLKIYFRSMICVPEIKTRESNLNKNRYLVTSVL